MAFGEYMTKIIVQMIMEEFKKFPNITVSQEMQAAIKVFVEVDGAKDLYYETGRMYYNKYPLFFIRWVIRRKYLKVFDLPSFSREAVLILADFQIKQAKKLLFKKPMKEY